jgi:hypothetical protein
MQDGQRKIDFPAKLEMYIHQVCSNPTDHQHDPKYKSGWDATSALGCPAVTIDDRQYCQFKCAF